MSVLFLDDEENVLYLLKRLFANESYGIATTNDPKEAERIIAREQIKVVVVDQCMPKISGIDFLGKIKKGCPDIVRVLLTAHTEFDVAEEAINRGEVYRFIPKPWNTAELKTAIRQAIEHFDLRAENLNLFEDTKRKKRELEVINKNLKALYEVQKEFVTTVSHELRTPLATIKSAVDIVASETAGALNEDQKNFLNKAKTHINRLKFLINDVLDLSKLESGEVELYIKPNNINALIREVIDAYEADVKEKNLSLKAELDTRLPSIPFDCDRINQVLVNLLDNSIKFTDQGGIIISSRRHKGTGMVEVCVEDTGRGIAQEDISKLFQKFKQLGDPSKRKTGGTGLGLALCKEIIQQHGGKVWAESKLGQGSRFYFTIFNGSL